MREIKIKYYFQNQVDKKEIENYIFEDIDNMYIGDFIYELNLDGGDFEVMDRCLYTGLKDKNGKEIYEGDILQFKWGNKKCIDYITFSGISFSLVKGYYRDNPLSWHPRDGFEIIGNIYENPELIG